MGLVFMPPTLAEPGIEIQTGLARRIHSAKSRSDSTINKKNDGRNSITSTVAVDVVQTADTIVIEP